MSLGIELDLIELSGQRLTSNHVTGDSVLDLKGAGTNQPE